MHVLKRSFHGNPNVGLHGYCTNADGKRLCLFGEHLSKKEEEAIAEALQAELHHVTIAGTPMSGVFLAGNKKALLVPSIAFEKEIKSLEKLGLPVTIFETTLTCLGNNLIANEHGCLVNPEFSDKEVAELENLLGVPVKRIEIAQLMTPGACIVLNGKKAIIHRDAEEYEIAMVKSTLHLESVEPASVNLGSPYVRAGILNNEKGFIIGDQSGGPEIVHIDQVLGYLK